MCRLTRIQLLVSVLLYHIPIVTCTLCASGDGDKIDGTAWLVADDTIYSSQYQALYIRLMVTINNVSTPTQFSMTLPLGDAYITVSLIHAVLVDVLLPCIPCTTCARVYVS